MGCHQSIEVQRAKERLLTHQEISKVGKLKVTILNCDFVDKENQKQKFIQVRVSNQSFTTSIHHNFGSHVSMNIDQTFNFAINSKQKMYGHMMTIQIWSKEDLRVDKEFALGIVDLDPILNKKQGQNETQQNKIKCFVNYERVAAGKVNLIAQFIPYTYKKVTIKIDSVIIRQHFHRERHLYVRTTIGEQIFQTSSALQTLKQPPKWNNQFNVFYIPQFLTSGLIQVLEKTSTNASDILIGQLKLDSNVLINAMNSNRPVQNYSEQIIIDDQVTGGIKFQVFNGEIDSQNDLVQPGSPKKISKKQKKVLTSLNVIKDQINQETNNKILKVKQRKLQRTFTVQSSPKKLPPLKTSHQISPLQNKAHDQKELKIQTKNSFISSLPAIKIDSISSSKIIQRNQKDDNSLQKPLVMPIQQIKPIKKSQLKIKMTQSFKLDTNESKIIKNSNTENDDQIQFLKEKTPYTEKTITNANQKDVENQEEKETVWNNFDNSFVKININQQAPKYSIFPHIFQDKSDTNGQVSKDSQKKLPNRQNEKGEQINAKLKQSESDQWQKCQIKKSKT